MMLPAGREDYADDDEIQALVQSKEDAQRAYEYETMALREGLVKQLRALDYSIKVRIRQLRHEDAIAEVKWTEQHPDAV